MFINNVLLPERAEYLNNVKMEGGNGYSKKENFSAPLYSHAGRRIKSIEKRG